MAESSRGIGTALDSQERVMRPRVFAIGFDHHEASRWQLAAVQ
jgi:hypothetical protein